MYVRDDKTDDVVVASDELQKIVRGETITLRFPGHGASLIVNMGLTLGWMGSSLAGFGMFRREPSDVVIYLIASLVVISVMGWIAVRVMRGIPQARQCMFTFSATLATFGVVMLGMALWWGDRTAIIVGAAGVFAACVAGRTVAGPRYALFAAVFRAKRAYGAVVAADAERNRIRNARRSP